MGRLLLLDAAFLFMLAGLYFVFAWWTQPPSMPAPDRGIFLNARGDP